jgi:ribosomal protein S16
MPRLRAIVLDSPDQQAARANFRVALWADVPAARQKFYAALTTATTVSAWIDALAADNTAIRNGSVVEKVVMYEPETTKTAGQMEADVATIWTAFQAGVTGTNTWPNYGSTWDGTTWTIATVA